MNNELTVLPEINKSNEMTVFVANGCDPIISRVQQLVNEFNENPPTLTTVKGRAKYKSIASNIAKSKKHVEKIGRELAASVKSEASEILEKESAIRQEVIRFTKTMDKMRDDVKAPAVEWEKFDTARQENHQQVIASINGNNRSIDDNGRNLSAEHLELRLQSMNEFDLSDANCEEFLPQYIDSVTTIQALIVSEFLPNAIKRESDEAELIALRQQQEQQQAIDKASEQSRIDKLNAEQKQKDAELMLENERKQSKLNAEIAEKQRLIDSDNAEKQRLQSIEDEKQAGVLRQQQEQRKKEQDEEDRESNTEHRKKFNREALEVIVEVGGISQEQGIEILKAIINKKVPHLAMSY